MPAEPRGTATQRGYGPKWRKARLGYLAHHPLCVMCQQRGVTTAATVVDHITPHRGDKKLFWKKTNWQSLCAPCHDGAKKSAEFTGVIRGCDEDGIPLDPRLRARWGAQGGA